MSEPVRDLAHLSHIELLTPKPEESLAYFRELLGMEVAGERGDSVYLRCFGDYETSSLKLTASESSGVGHLAYRAASPEALARRVAALDAGGVAGEWLDGDLGHGRAYSFLDADGHRIETVLMLYPDRVTVCVSSQAGCAMGCGFCGCHGRPFGTVGVRARCGNRVPVCESAAGVSADNHVGAIQGARGRCHVPVYDSAL